MKFRVTPPILDHLSGLNPGLGWDYRMSDGVELATPKDEYSAARSLAHQRFIESGKKEEKFQEAINRLSEVIGKYEKLGAAGVQDYIGNKKIKLVIGQSRTGGTYLTECLAKLYDFPLHKGQISLMHDGYFSFDLLAEWKHIPESAEKLRSELGFFACYINEIFGKEPVIVKKRSWAGFGIEPIHHFFGDSLDFILTVRHPMACVESLRQLLGLSELQAQATSFPKQSFSFSLWQLACLNFPHRDVSRWENLNLYEMYLTFWETFYTEVSEQRKSIAMDVVEYHDIPEYLSNLSKSMNKQLSFDQFKIKKREWHSYWPTPDQVDHAIERVTTVWKKNGHEFPKMIF